MDSAAGHQTEVGRHAVPGDNVAMAIVHRDDQHHALTAHRKLDVNGNTKDSRVDPNRKHGVTKKVSFDESTKFEAADHHRDAATSILKQSNNVTDDEASQFDDDVKASTLRHDGEVRLQFADSCSSGRADSSRDSSISLRKAYYGRMCNLIIREGTKRIALYVKKNLPPGTTLPSVMANVKVSTVI